MYDLMLVSRVDRAEQERERDRAKRVDWRWCREVVVVGLRVAGDGIRVCTV